MTIQQQILFDLYLRNQITTVFGYDGVISINSAGKFVNGHGNILTLRGMGVGAFEAAIYSNQPIANQAWGNNGPGGPPWMTIKNWLQGPRTVNIVRLTMSANCWLNVTLGELDPSSTAANPVWNATTSYQADQNGVIKPATVAFIQWARLIGAYIIWDCHFTSPNYTFGGTTKAFGDYGQPSFIDADHGFPYWTAALGAGPGNTDSNGYASSGVFAWLCRYFGSATNNSNLGVAGAGGVIGAAGDFWNAAYGGTSGFNDIIFELFNEPYPTNYVVNLNSANLGAGTTLTAAQFMKNGGWASGYRNQSIGTGLYNVSSGGPYHPGLPGASYTPTSISGNGTVITVAMTGYSLGPLQVGQKVQINGVTGTTSYNGTWTIASSSISGSTITLTLTSTVTGTATLTGASVSSGIYGPSGQANTTGDLYGVNYWWQATGYQPLLTALRANGCTNIIQCNPMGFATTFNNFAAILPTDTLSPPQISIGVHGYQYGTSGFPASLDAENATANQLQHWQNFIAGANTYTIGSNNYNGPGHPIPILVDETGDVAGATVSQPAPYMRSIAEWALGGTDTSKGITFNGTFGCTPWHYCVIGALSYGTTSNASFQMTIYGAPITFQGYANTTQQSGYPQGTGTITITNANGNTVAPGLVITGGSSVFLPCLGPQLSGTANGAGVYVCSIAFTQGSSGSPITFTGQYQLPLNGEGLTWAQYG